MSFIVHEMNSDHYQTQIVEEISKELETNLLTNWPHKIDNLTQRILNEILNLLLQKGTDKVELYIFQI